MKVIKDDFRRVFLRQRLQFIRNRFRKETQERHRNTIFNAILKRMEKVERFRLR